METIAVIFGGRSAEHDVSIITALSSIIKPLELSKKYRVEAIYIAKDGAWYWDEKLKSIDIYKSGKINDFIRKSEPVSLKLDGGLTLVKNGHQIGRKVSQKIDVVFPAMHGTYGEDGALMGLLDMATVAYVGCDLASSTVAMDKSLSKQVALANQIPVTKFVLASKDEIEHDIETVVKRVTNSLSYPVFIKPTHLGSSIGISRADNDTALNNGLEVAAHYDDAVLIEEEVANLAEVTLPIIGNDVLTPALLEQPLTKPEDFFDFDTKYLRGGKKGKGQDGTKGSQGYSKIPADLPKDLYDKAIELGLRTYRTVGCQGIARVDMLIDTKTKEVYFNEINPLPGSLYSHNWHAAGISSIELVERLVSLAKDRFKNQQKLATTFDTSFLQQF
jgi:D-alanine-D-alanine ligase